MMDTQSARARLAAQLAELQARQLRLDRDLATPLDPDSGEQAVEKEDDEALEAQAVLVAREIGSVNRALSRIERGTYGECVRCGMDIDPRRLEARPEAALCLSCAQQEH